MYPFHRLRLPFLLLASIALLLSACDGTQAEATPTVDIAMIQTRAVETFAFGLTQTALAMPTDTPTPTPSPTATPTLTPPAPTSGAPAGGGTAATATCYGLTFASDVTIPDNTPMNPGEAFTKTWQVLNSGTCTWEVGFRLNFVSGNAMGGANLTLSQPVPPGAVTELSVAMVAPATGGTVRGDWRMSTSTGTYFGDVLYVIINVNGPTSTPTP
ncbi:MAG: NBR1-Ig-like domain-containing protein [Anaerolineales bacterium]